MGKNKAKTKAKARAREKKKTKEIQIENAWLQQIGFMSVREPGKSNGLRPANVAASLELEVGRTRTLLQKMEGSGHLAKYSGAYWPTPKAHTEYGISDNITGQY